VREYVAATSGGGTGLQEVRMIRIKEDNARKTNKHLRAPLQHSHTHLRIEEILQGRKY
jgi:hypothetical protein